MSELENFAAVASCLLWRGANTATFDFPVPRQFRRAERAGPTVPARCPGRLCAKLQALQCLGVMPRVPDYAFGALLIRRARVLAAISVGPCQRAPAQMEPRGTSQVSNFPCTKALVPYTNG